MIKFHKKIAVFKVYETWFTHKYSLRDIFGLNAFMHIKGKRSKKIFGVREITHTIEIDLMQETDCILSNFSGGICNQSKKSEKEGTTCFFHHDIDGFVKFYNDFATKKGTYTTSKEKLQTLGNYLKISSAKNNGKILAAHSYMVDEELGIVRGINSGTMRLNDNYDKNLIGRANKYLFLKDILHFKKMGLKTFDFGGYAKDTTNPSLKGINEFKLMFGGKVVKCINYYSYNYWLLKKVTKLFGLTGKL